MSDKFDNGESISDSDIVTCDESWIYYNKSETKRQSAQ